jgi:general L-amino acid transport system substrate-binding protein
VWLAQSLSPLYLLLRPGHFIPLVVLLLAWASGAHAAGTFDRIRADGVLHCGAVERPGIAEPTPSGQVLGVAADLCLAIAIAVLGPSARVSFTIYEAPRSFDGVRHGSDEIAFLTGDEIAEQDLARFVVPGPTVLISSVAVMVPESSPARQLADLSGQTVCLMIGSRAQRALESAALTMHLAISRLTFEEDVEMLDAYNAGSCGAAVGETTYLADMRRNPGVRQLASRLLPDVLAADPLVAVTPQTDGAWTAAAAWVIDALLLADAPTDAWTADAANALPVQHPPGLRQDWQAAVATAIGSYNAIIRRNLTERLGLAPGLNALWPAGKLLPPAIR